MKIGAITLSITPELVNRLSAALREQTAPPDYSILVANSPRVLAQGKHQAEWDEVLNPGFNTSFSTGNNMAEAVMPSDITHLLLLNDDLIPSPTFIERLALAAVDVSPPDIIGALFVHRDGTVNHAGGAEANPALAYGSHIGRGTLMSGWSGTATVPWVTFAGVLVDRVLWKQLRGLDEGFVYGYDDHDFCLRALEKGAKIVVARDAVGVHEECATRMRGGPREAQNYHFFRERWGNGCMDAILADYLTRFPHAEGIPR